MNDDEEEKEPIPNLIYAYTRAMALADGVLVDLSAWAAESGFTVPVACTDTVWQGYLQPPKGSEAAEGQSVRGRVHDLLTVLFYACRRAGGVDTVSFEVAFIQAQEGGFQRETVTLKAVIGPGDAGEPVLTVMLPHED